MAKMHTLEEAVTQLQSLHAVVERIAMAVRSNQSTQPLMAQLRRVGQPLAAALKAQFGMISDQVIAMMLAATRGGNDQMRVRALREGIATIRQALEISIAQVKIKHEVHDEKAEAAKAAKAAGDGAPADG